MENSRLQAGAGRLTSKSQLVPFAFRCRNEIFLLSNIWLVSGSQIFHRKWRNRKGRNSLILELFVHEINPGMIACMEAQRTNSTFLHLRFYSHFRSFSEQLQLPTLHNHLRIIPLPCKNKQTNKHKETL